ncbi:MAG: hypothetical protein HKN87_02070 [Saprospiraceae bacterium]|nr:hypothetical protein [Saprospiraceae bacterium]
MVNDDIDFRASLEQTEPPKGLSLYLQALWYDAKGDWGKAHDIAQDIVNENGSWIHAYLHRKEGDGWNANYWYEKAGKSMPAKSLDDEWSDLVEVFLNK